MAPGRRNVGTGEDIITPRTFLRSSDIWTVCSLLGVGPGEIDAAPLFVTRILALVHGAQDIHGMSEDPGQVPDRNCVLIKSATINMKQHLIGCWSFQRKTTGRENRIVEALGGDAVDASRLRPTFHYFRRECSVQARGTT
jgi:hypothetical protein